MKKGKKESDASEAAEGTMSNTPTAVVLDFLAEAEHFYRAGEIEQACFRAFRAFHFSTFLPNWPPVDGRPYDRSTLFDILDQERPDRLPDAAFVAAREHLAKGEWTAAAVVLNDLTGLLDFLSRRFEDEVPT